MAKKKTVKHTTEKKNVWKGFQLAGLAGTVMVMAFVVMGMASNSVKVGQASVEASSRYEKVMPTQSRRPTMKVSPRPTIRVSITPKLSPKACLDTQRMCALDCPMTVTANGCECVCGGIGY